MVLKLYRNIYPSDQLGNYLYVFHNGLMTYSPSGTLSPSSSHPSYFPYLKGSLDSTEGGSATL